MGWLAEQMETRKTQKEEPGPKRKALAAWLDKEVEDEDDAGIILEALKDIRNFLTGK